MVGQLGLHIPLPYSRTMVCFCENQNIPYTRGPEREMMFKNRNDFDRASGFLTRLVKLQATQ